MNYLIITIIIGVIVFIYASRYGAFSKISPKISSDSPTKIQDADLVKTLLSLDEESLSEILYLYKNQFGRGAGRYARKTFQKWKAGKVRPNRQTFERFLIQLPKVMSYDLKCEVLRRLMEEYCSKNDYRISVFTDNWETTLEPLIKQIIDKSYTADLPRLIEEKLDWLANGEMQIAQKILKESQVKESHIAVSMLREEISDIEKLIVKVKGESRVTHQLKFPYGTVTLEIKRR
jgi:hypothetical protein